MRPEATRQAFHCFRSRKLSAKALEDETSSMVPAYHRIGISRMA
jgi:hypothetical protein